MRSEKSGVGMFYSFTLLTAINAEMKARGMTQQELARRAGISNSFLSAILSGEGNPSLQVLAAIASTFDVPLSRLFETPEVRPRGAAEAPGDFLPGGGRSEQVPLGYRRVNCILPESRASIVDEWAVIARKALLRDQPKAPAVPKAPVKNADTTTPS